MKLQIQMEITYAILLTCHISSNSTEQYKIYKDL